ncbi:MAG: aldehyde ferredoxin oxidoreductase family protein [Planctomycetota bacterium]|jgi:aldehyde:ferredoxin oxidoreductase
MNSSLLSGYHGRILEVDLTRRAIESRPLNMRMAEDYLGGRGLATRLFIDNVVPSCDPLSADNVLVLAASPLLGTTAPTACRGHFVFKSPLTGVIGSTNCGGSWAYFFKCTGYDVLILKGASDSPVMIDITADEAKLLPADHLWGLDVHQTTDQLIASNHSGGRSRVLAIGQAGENLVSFSAVMNDKNRAYGRTGLGAVFGSKNLKAIRVYGKDRTGVEDEEQYKSGLDQARYLLKAAPVTKRLLRDMGTVGLLKLIDVIDMLPHLNFQDNRHVPDELNNVSGEAIRDNILDHSGACFRCPIGCQRHTLVRGKKGEGPEYETTVMMGPNCGIYDHESIALANYLCNEYGIDTISTGGTIACAMEMFEKGIISEKETDGLDLSFGNKDVLEEVVRRIAFREGIGDLLARGSLSFAEHYGHPEFSMTVKSMEIPAYDPRASFTQALGYMTSPTGACHLRGGYAVSLAFFGGTREIPRFSLLQSPIAIRNMQRHGIIQDSLGICRFTGFAYSDEPWARMVSGVTGLDFSTERLEETAARILALERIFNIRAGAKPEDDTLPDRFKNEPILIGGEERSLPEDTVLRLRNDYYNLMDWDEAGNPPDSVYEELKVEKD